MAEYKWETGLSKTAEGISTSCTIFISKDDINAKAKANIPRNAVLDEVVISVQMRQGYTSSNTDGWIIWNSNNSSTTPTESSKVKNLRKALDQVTNSWKTFSTNDAAKESNDVINDATPDFYQSGDNVGQIQLENANYLAFMQVCTFGRRLLIQNPIITWTYHIPTYTLTVTAGEGGTVTGTPSGTYEAGTQISIAAAPNEGYRFVSWSDGVTENPRTGSLMWHASYTAIFEKQVESYYLDLNGLLDGTASGNIAGYGTADVYINGALAAQGVTDYYSSHESSTAYEIKNIKANEGYQYDGVASGSLSGTIGKSAVNIQLKFSTKPLKFTSAEIVYSNKQVSDTNKVPAGQSFVVRVGVGY